MEPFDTIDPRPPGAPNSVDFAILARLNTPTDAQVLKGALESAGILAHVADAHLVQANSFLTQAVGGVRVLVRADRLAEAREVMRAYEAGELALEPMELLAFEIAPASLYSIDRATLLGWVLTPLFPFLVEWANARRQGQSAFDLARAIWGLLLVAATLASIALGLRAGWGSWTLLRASLQLSFLTVVWYFLEGRGRSAAMYRRYGAKFPQAPLGILAVWVLVLEWGAGALLSAWVA